MSFFLSSFSVLPQEVIGLIADHLSTADLSRCVRVCKGFYSVWIDYLFRDMALTDPSQFESFEMEAAQKQFSKHCRLTRSFVSSSALEHGRMLRDSRCWSLRHLDLQFSPWSTDSFLTVPDLLQALIESNSCLQRVALTGRFNWTMALDQLSVSACLSDLVLNFLEVELLEEATTSDGKSQEKPRSLSGLKKLSVVDLRGSYNSILVLLRGSPNLEFLRLKLVDAWAPPEDAKGELMALLSNIECMAWESREIDEDELVEMLALGAETKRVSFSVPVVRSFAPLVDRAAAFKSLTLDGVLGSFSSELQDFLERATALESLCALPAAQFENQHVRLLARNFHDRTGEMQMLDDLAGPTRVWGCALTLTRLEIVIERLHPTYVDGTSSAVDGQTLPMSVECCLEHTVAYRQLGLLINLQHLRLGQEMAPRMVGGSDERGGYQTNCLLFSVESGIDLLSGMTSIQTLDVRWTAHEIGCPELQWMHDNWPQLDGVLGLTDLPSHAGPEWCKRSEGAAAWIKARPRGIGRDL